MPVQCAELWLCQPIKLPEKVEKSEEGLIGDAAYEGPQRRNEGKNSRRSAFHSKGMEPKGKHLDIQRSQKEVNSTEVMVSRSIPSHLDH